MKGLDTPVLVALLRGNAAARRLVRSLTGEELATTEWNFFELEWLARANPSPGRVRRVASFEYLSRRLTVVSVVPYSVRVAFPRSDRARSPPNEVSVLRLVLGALEANGASEWYTTKEWASATSPGRCKVRQFDPQHA